MRSRQRLIQQQGDLRQTHPVIAAPQRLALQSPEAERKTHWRTHHYGWLTRTIEGCSGSLKVNLSLLLRQLKNLDEILVAYGEEVEALAVTPRYREPVKALTLLQGHQAPFCIDDDHRDR